MHKQDAIPAPSGPSGAPRVVAPLVQRERSDQVAAIGLPKPWLRDLYHNLLTLPWPIFLVALSLVYLGLNVLFSLLYLAVVMQSQTRGPGRLRTRSFSASRPLDDRLRADVAGDALRKHHHDLRSAGRIDARGGRRWPDVRTLLAADRARVVQQGRCDRAARRCTGADAAPGQCAPKPDSGGASFSDPRSRRAHCRRRMDAAFL